VVPKATIESEDKESEDEDDDMSQPPVAQVMEPPAEATGMEQAIWALASSVKELAEVKVEVTCVLSDELENIWVTMKECVDGVWVMGQEVGNIAAMVELFA